PIDRAHAVDRIRGLLVESKACGQIARGSLRMVMNDQRAVAAEVAPGADGAKQVGESRAAASRRVRSEELRQPWQGARIEVAQVDALAMRISGVEPVAHGNTESFKRNLRINPSTDGGWPGKVSRFLEGQDDAPLQQI